MRLRAAQAADIEQLARVAVASYRHAFAGILEPENLARCDHAFFAARFARELAKITLAEDDTHAIVGFSLVTGANIDMLFLAPERIGQGVGGALLREIEGKGAATLECFRDNDGARRFYERHGWRLDRSYSRDYLGRMRDFVTYRKGPPAT